MTDKTDWWRGAVIYQVYPRSFQDDSGDGIGDLAGVTRRLPHIASLGVDAIWLSPVFTSPMADMGYDVSDYTNIDPLFGTLRDFDAFVEGAHALGLKVIIDQVLSHTSDRHPWFAESRSDRTNPKADWYVWAHCQPDGNPPNNWLSVFGGRAWEWDTRRRQYYLHNFLPSQPDLNFHNPEVREALLGAMRFWLDRGVDGFRLDTVNYYFHDDRFRANPPAKWTEPLPAVNPYEMQDQIYSKTRPENIGWLRQIRALTDAYPDRCLIGEVGESRRAVKVMAEYTSGPDRLHMAYSFDMLGPEFTAAHFRSRIEKFFRGAPGGWPSWAFSNHDVQRHVTRWLPHAANEETLAKQAIAMLIAFQGTIGIYQGEELGLTETDLLFEELTDPPGIRFWPDYKGRDGCRTPMVWDGSENAGFSPTRPWLPIKAPQLGRNAAGQEHVPGSVLNFYRAAIAFRKSRPELIAGRTAFVPLPEPVLAFHRETGARRLTCVFNLSSGEVPVALSGGATTVGPEMEVRIADGFLHLGPNGFVYLDSGDAPAPELSMPARQRKPL